LAPKLLDVFLLCLAPLRRFLFECGSTLLEELLLPSVKNGWLMTVLIAQIRDGNPVDQIPIENENRLLSGVVFSLFAHVEFFRFCTPTQTGEFPNLR
jgi:hypothetical protein